MNSRFWDQLLSMASSIEQLEGSDEEKKSQLIAQLETIDVLYHRQFDPADVYPEYVAVTLCRAISSALSTQSK